MLVNKVNSQRKEGRKKGRKEGRKEGRGEEEGRKEGRKKEGREMTQLFLLGTYLSQYIIEVFIRQCATVFIVH